MNTRSAVQLYVHEQNRFHIRLLIIIIIHINIMNTILIAIQNTPTTKRDKLSIPVEWTRNDIRRTLDQYGSQYGLQTKTKNKNKVFLLQQHFKPFHNLNADEICHCLNLMSRDRRGQKFAIEIVQSDCGYGQEKQQQSLDKLTAIQSRCAQLVANRTTKYAIV